MLKEVKNIRQTPGEPERRWFTNSYFDLIIWLDANTNIIEFQLCYDKSGDERVLTWRQNDTYSHDHVDQGEDKPGRRKATPVFLPDGIFDHKSIAKTFLQFSEEIDPKISSMVFEKISNFEN